MQVVTGLATLGTIALAGAVVTHGLANTIDWCAWKLHRAAVSLRRMQDARTKEIVARWVRELEG